jgi:hypothetical protein
VRIKVPTRKPTLHFISGSGEPLIENVRWHEIEKAYDKPFSQEVRQDILSATRAYLLFAQLEKRQPLSNAQKRLARLSKSAKAFHDALQRDNPPSDDAVFVDYLIAKHLCRGNNLGHVEGLMASFVRACELAASEINDISSQQRRRPSGKQRQQRTAWGKWIRKLKSIADAHNLRSDPGQNVEGGVTSSPMTPFAFLVSVLQDCFPQGYEQY